MGATKAEMMRQIPEDERDILRQRVHALTQERTNLLATIEQGAQENRDLREALERVIDDHAGMAHGDECPARDCEDECEDGVDCDQHNCECCIGRVVEARRVLNPEGEEEQDAGGQSGEEAERT